MFLVRVTMSSYDPHGSDMSACMMLARNTCRGSYMALQTNCSSERLGSRARALDSLLEGGEEFRALTYCPMGLYSRVDNPPVRPAAKQFPYSKGAG